MAYPCVLRGARSLPDSSTTSAPLVHDWATAWIRLAQGSSRCQALQTQRPAPAPPAHKRAATASCSRLECRFAWLGGEPPPSGHVPLVI